MKSIAIFLRVVLITVFSAGAIAQAEDEFLQKLNAINTLSGSFTQTITDQDGIEIQESTSGKFLIKRPGYFYWETQPPYEQLIIGNPDRLWVYDPDLEQVTVHNQSQLENSPASILSGDDKNIKEKYTVTAENVTNKNNSDKKKQRVVKYHLRSKADGQKSFDTLTFMFQGDVLQSLVLKDSLGQTTEIVFNDVKVNREIDSAQFDFEPPPGVDIIIQE